MIVVRAVEPDVAVLWAVEPVCMCGCRFCAVSVEILSGAQVVGIHLSMRQRS